MNSWQTNFLIIFALLNIIIFVKGFYESYKKKNAFGETPLLRPLGIFVWGDAAVFGIFWVISSILSLITKDFILFCLLISLFWLVRSIGETIYWMLQQFSPVIREDPKRHKFLYKYFHNESVWFIYQIIHQCITVFTLLLTIYFMKLWLTS